jgi:hypothetical protein
LRKVIALDPKRAAAHTNLGSALVGKHTEEGIAEFRKAAQLDPTDARAYCGLGLALVEQGSFAEARTAFRRCQQLRPEGHPLRNFATQRLQQHERAMDLDAQLAAVLKGQARPADAAERLALADHCRQPYKRLYAASARFYAEAVEAPPGLAADLRAGHRYHAARAAALASVGKGEDAAKLDDRERADLRKQALDWLRADLALWSKRAGGDDPNDRAGVQKQLEHWQTDPDLAGVRDKDALGKLLADEQKAWRKLWDDVSAVLKRASEPR